MCAVAATTSCYCYAARLAALPIKIMTVPILISVFFKFLRAHFMTTHDDFKSFVAYAACYHQEGEALIGGESTSAPGQACYFTVANQTSSHAYCLLQITLIQRIHSAERWLLMGVDGHIIPAELAYFRKKVKAHLCIVLMKSIYFEKYCTLINDVTQSR